MILPAMLLLAVMLDVWVWWMRLPIWCCRSVGRTQASRASQATRPARHRRAARRALALGVVKPLLESPIKSTRGGRVHLIPIQLRFVGASEGLPVAAGAKDSKRHTGIPPAIGCVLEERGAVFEHPSARTAQHTHSAGSQHTTVARDPELALVI
jgi:hypothetical protein